MMRIKMKSNLKSHNFQMILIKNLKIINQQMMNTCNYQIDLLMRKKKSEKLFNQYLVDIHKKIFNTSKEKKENQLTLRKVMIGAKTTHKVALKGLA